MSKTHEVPYELLEDMAANAYQWPTECFMPRKVRGVHEIDTLSVLSDRVAILSKHISSLTTNAIHTLPKVCELCNKTHYNIKCKVRNPFSLLHLEDVMFVRDFNK